jgi:hypothetical protein
LEYDTCLNLSKALQSFTDTHPLPTVSFLKMAKMSIHGQHIPDTLDVIPIGLHHGAHLVFDAFDAVAAAVCHKVCKFVICQK